MFKSFQQKFPEYFFIIKFISLFVFLYFFCEVIIGFSSTGNYYNSFIDNYFNIIKWYRISILKTSEKFCNIIGYHATMTSSLTLEGHNGFRVNMVYSCIGYGIISFWISFCATIPMALKRKLKWLFGGIFLLWMANVIRVSLLLILINKNKNVETFSHHHLAYNVATYIIIFGMIYYYLKGNDIKSK